MEQQRRPPTVHLCLLSPTRARFKSASGREGWNSRDPAKVLLPTRSIPDGEEPLGVYQRAKRNYCFPLSQVAKELTTGYQGNVAFTVNSHCCPLRLRMAR